MNTWGKGKLRESVGDGLNQSLDLPVLDWSGLVVQTWESKQLAQYKTENTDMKLHNTA